MYTACLFCTQPLGANEAIEAFPVGRRLAFDVAKGRLWVVCRACGRWNLTPLEERWEAIESCERAFRDTRVRVSTDNIGLARLPEGLELVRVGQPLRPEFAAWRYGDQFGRRRRQTLIRLGAMGAAGGALVIGGVAAGVLSGGTLVLGLLGRRWMESLADRRRVARLVVDGVPIVVRQGDWDRARLAPLHGSDEPTLQLPHARGTDRYTGREAERVLGQLLPQVNRMGGTPLQVREAVREIEQAGDATHYFGYASRQASRLGITALTDLPHEVRLALEMAAHEDAERRALEGELAELEQAWKDAEEIAGIADHMLLSPEVEARLRRLQQPGLGTGDSG
jgi:hypothetical protein